MIHVRQKSQFISVIFILFVCLSYWYMGRQGTVQTAKGPVTWKEIETNVFLPMGYKIQDSSQLIPTLRHVIEPTCEQVFSEWLAIAESYRPGKVPPRAPAEFSRNYYTLNGYARYLSKYYNHVSTSTPQVWDMINDWMNADPKTFVSYRETGGLTVPNALKYHRLDGGSGVVIGSLRPWVEVLALRAGASKVLTVDYQNTTIIGTNKMEYIHPLDFAEQFRRYSEFDFAASFSSLEHSGLERYGDPADPIGDIREALKIRCILKKNGLFFLGVPTNAQDAVYFNELRVYGRIRLALMFAEFELLNVFRKEAPFPADVRTFLTTTDERGIL